MHTHALLTHALTGAGGMSCWPCACFRAHTHALLTCTHACTHTCAGGVCVAGHAHV